jgi:rhomboid protease GluP
MYPPPDDPSSSYPPDLQQPPGAQRVRVSVPQTRPIVVYSLLGVTITLFLLQMASNFLLGYDLLAAIGVKANNLIIAGQFWRLFTPMFLHNTSSILHIAFNMYALYALGTALEIHYGHWRFIALYLVSGFAGNVISFLFTSSPSLGASTAIFGLLGAEAIFLYRNRQLFGAAAQRALTNVVVIAVINLIFGLQPGIDNWGHIGGLLGGTFFAWFAGPLYHVEGNYYSAQLVDEHGTREAITAGAIDLLIFVGLAALKIIGASS